MADLLIVDDDEDATEFLADIFTSAREALASAPQVDERSTRGHADHEIPMTVPKSRLRPAMVFAPFLLLALLFASSDLMAMRRVAKLRTAAEDGMQETVARNDLLSRMERDLDRVQFLAERHVFEDVIGTREAVDASLASSESDYAEAAANYESMLKGSVQRARWLQLKAEVAEIWPLVRVVLETSSRSDPRGAAASLAAIEGDFSSARGDLRALRRVNGQAVDDALTRVVGLQKTATVLLQLFGFTGMGLSVVVGLAMVRALRRRDDRLHRYAETLEISNRELDAFAGRVAHDLRNPLSTASLAAERLATRSPSPEQTKAIDVLHRSFRRMSAIIADLLAISRIQGVDPGRACNPAAAAEQVREELAPRVEGSDVDLVFDVQPACVRCSEGLLRQVLWNLADNAIKYRRTEVPSRVEICGRSADDRYELSVRDNGVGILPDEAGKVFDAFYRVAGRKGPPGTGLGLSIVKRAVEANGGTVSVSSTPGLGSEFVARLPLAGSRT